MNQEFKGTKGEWYINPCASCGFEVHSDNGTNSPDSVCEYVYKQEDARLIAAAPELLEALQNLLVATEELATIIYMITTEQGQAINVAKDISRYASRLKFPKNQDYSDLDFSMTMMRMLPYLWNLLMK